MNVIIDIICATVLLVIVIFLGEWVHDREFPTAAWRAIKDRFKERYRIQEITQEGFTRYEVQSKGPFFGCHTFYSYLQYHEAEYALEKVLQKERKKRQKKTTRTLKEEIV